MNKQEAQKLERSILSKVSKGRMILGLSGGPDSVFLLHLLKKHDIVAAHLNHKIRSEANKDQDFVEKLCNTLNIPLETIEVDIEEKSQELGRGIEEVGRLYRYEFFRNLAEKHQAKTIITGHHADDNLETILMNFTRGGSLRALAGMSIEDKIDNTHLLRPLIHTPKSKILDYLKLHKIPYLIDASNKDIKYTRNNLRHEVIPRLNEINPNLVSTIARNHQNLAEINDFLDESALAWIKKYSSNNIPVQEFNQLHPALQKAILINLHQLHIGNILNLESIHVQEALQLIHNNIGNKKKKMGKIHLQLKKGRIILKK